MKLHIVLFALVILGLLATARRGANLLWDEAESRVVGFDVGLCTWTPAVNNTGPLYNLCNTVHYFNDGADQVMLLGAVFIDLENGAQPMAVVGGAGAFRGASGTCTIQGFAENFNFLFVCDFFTPKYN